MKKKPLPKEFLKLARSITNKRARIVIEHILKHGYITTEELESDYGYNHPPRAARDVREAGIPLETFRIKDKEGRNIAAYRFGDVTQIQRNRLRGRLVFPKGLKERLYEQQNGKCAICSGILENRYLQIDHKVPYEVAGDEGIESFQVSEFMLLCASCNRAKSWSCEHCLNLKKEKDSNICRQCYWGNPENYLHIALKSLRRMDLIWQGEETTTYEKLKNLASRNRTPLPDFVKKVLEKSIRMG
jgi:hypothetical protein